MKGMQRISRGSGFRGALEYAFYDKKNPGPEDKKRGYDGVLIGGNMAGTNPRELAAEFKLAQQMRLRGTVKVSATVAPTGKVVKTELIGGSPVFVPYALNAVSLLKWEPGPKETMEIVEIDFVPRVRQ